MHSYTTAQGAVARTRHVLLFIACLGLASSASSLDPHRLVTQYVHQTWSVEDGLPESTAQAIFQSRDGYLWIATQEGLARFDGVRFEVFDKKKTPEIRESFFTSLAEESSGALWVGGFGGVVRYAAGSFRAFTSRNGLPADDVRALAVDRAGRVWAGTRAGLARLSGDRFEKVDLETGARVPRITALRAGRDGSLWVGSDEGLCRWKDGSVLRIAGEVQKESVAAIEENEDGSLLVGTRQGSLFRIEGSDASRFVPADALGRQPVFALLRDRAGTLWVGTVGRGLLRWEGSAFVPFPLAGGEGENGVRSLFEDSQGSLWIGTLTDGLIRLRDGPFRSYSSLEGLPAQAANAVLEDRQGEVWIASSTALSRMPREGGPVRTFGEKDGLPPGILLCLHEDRAGRIWVGTQSGGLATFEDGVFRSAPTGFPAFPILAIVEDAQGRVWIGTDGGGIAMLEGGVWRIFTTQEGLASNSIHDLAFARDGALWAATYTGGLSRYADGHFTTHGAAQGLGRVQTLSLHADADGGMWAGTLGAGLFRVGTDGRVASFTSGQGMCDDLVYAILEDNAGFLWTSNNHGVSRVRKQDLLDVAAGKRRAFACTPYGRSDGLRFGECNGGSQPAAWKAADGRLWFVIRRGVAVVDPIAVTMSPPAAPPRVIGEDVLVNHLVVAPSPRLTTASGRADLEIHYTASNLASPETTRFRVRLAGYDRDWVDAGTRRAAYYTNLPPSEYRFEAAARTGDGPWGAPRTLFEIRVPPRLYQRRLFWVFVAAAMFGLIGAAYGTRIRAAKLREADLARRVVEEIARVKILRGLLPICASCKKIRDDKGYWNQIESFIHTHSEAEFSHGICPECMHRLYPEYAEDPPTS